MELLSMHSQINRSNFSANLSSYFDPSTSIKQAFDEQISLKPLVPYSEDQASQPKRARQRSSRACDACRKHKVKCLLRENGTCQNCFAACKPCTFETVGVKRERPPTKRDVELLNRRIQELERILGVISPSLDLKSLPRTADQARSIVRIISSQSNKTLTKEPPEMERLDLADLISTLRILDEFSPASDQPDSDNCPSEEVTALARKLAQTLRFEIPSSCSVNYVEERLIGLASIAELPSPDLADSLIDLFFKNVNPFENLLHKAEFMRLYTSGLAQTSRSFRGLCFSVFAAGSRFSLDPRVFHSPGNKSFNAQAVGALFLFSGLDLLANDLSPFTLYDLQSSALLCYFTCCSCSPLTAWSCIASWIRRVQATGAHRENSPRWKVSMMTDQLRKRAVWYLAYMEVQVCKSLGRSLTIKAQEMDLELPLCIDDDTLSKIDSITFNKSPDAVNNLTNSNLDMLTGNPSQKIWNAIYSMRKKHGYLLQEFSYVKRPPDISTSSRATLTAFLADMDVSLEQCISGGELYNNMDSPHEFLLNARLHFIIINTKIMTLRFLYGGDLSPVSLCLKDSNNLIDILDHISSRGLLESSASWIPYSVTPAALTLLSVAREKNLQISPIDRANAWAGVHRCINILNIMSSWSFIAERLSISINQLVQVCIDEELFIKPKENPENQKKRSADESISFVKSENDKATEETSKEELSYLFPDIGAPNRLSNEALKSQASNTMKFESSEQVRSKEYKADYIFKIPHTKLENILLEHPGRSLAYGIQSSSASSSRMQCSRNQENYFENDHCLDSEFNIAEEVLISDWFKYN